MRSWAHVGARAFKEKPVRRVCAFPSLLQLGMG